MTSLNSLKSLLNKLKKEEIRYLEKFLELNQKSRNENRTKSIKLIKMLISDKNSNSTELQLHLYGGINYSAFNKLIVRIKDKIYDLLLLDQNLEKTITAKRNRVIFNIRKKLIQSEIMFSRGITEELVGFQKKIINTAK